MMPGVDLAEPSSPRTDTRFAPGDKSWGRLRTGRGAAPAGFAEFARVAGEWVMPLPPGLSTREAMAWAPPASRLGALDANSSKTTAFAPRTARAWSPARPAASAAPPSACCAGCGTRSAAAPARRRAWLPAEPGRRRDALARRSPRRARTPAGDTSAGRRPSIRSAAIRWRICVRTTKYGGSVPVSASPAAAAFERRISVHPARREPARHRVVTARWPYASGCGNGWRRT